ncbi:DUF4142 domain-containing protein [Methylocella sp.]|uniref:DUF4142 domain-containing protein n=1 Tax=Methylocella sp. TaxID=1978226 RepID=UPI003783785A
MTRKAALAGGALSLLALFGVEATSAESITEKTGVNAMLGVSPSTPDFVREAAVSDMFEIESGALAKEKGNAATKAFAEKLVSDHGAAAGSLRAVMAEHSIRVDLPHALNGSAQSRMNALKALTGEKFDQRFRDDQIEAHKEAIDLFERYARGGDNEALKHWAENLLPGLRAHLAMAERL